MKALFEDAVGVVPPSTVDIDRLIARRRRLQRLRRVGSVGLAVAVIGSVIGALTSVTSLLPDDGPPPSATAAPSTPPNTDDETPAQRGDRFAAALKAILAERAPGITAVGTDPADPFRFEADARRQGARIGSTPTARPEGPHTFSWFGTVTGPAGSAELRLTISDVLIGLDRDELANLPSVTCMGDPRGRELCETTEGPNGERIRRAVTDYNTFRTDPQILVSHVDVVLADLTSVSLMSPHGGRLGGPEPFGLGEPVLTLEQLTAIATDIRLAW